MHIIRQSSLVAFITTLFLAFRIAHCNFFLGDFVPTARKAQFQGQRTQWHDVLGAHCPKFGVNRYVALPLPQPQTPDHNPPNEYKLQFGFDGDRVVTPWLPVLGRKAPEAPVLHVELVRSGDALVGAVASIGSLSQYDPDYTRVREEFGDPRKWPKHLPTHFTWKSRHAVDTGRGLTVVFAGGIVWLGAVLLGVASTYRKQLKHFLDDVTGESGGTFTGEARLSHKAE